MTKLLEKAFQNASVLSEEEQDELATFMLDYVESHTSESMLTPEQIAEVELSMQEAREGKFATQEEMAALWKRFGL
jgi:predicted transcriptional regulator